MEDAGIAGEVLLPELGGDAALLAQMAEHLCRLCPEYAPTYMMLREEATKNGLLIEREEDEVENKLADAFNDHTVTDADFQRMLEEADKKGAEFIAFSKRVRKLNFPKMID